MSINKLKNAWISTDTTIDGINSLVNEGKTRLKNDVVLDTKIAINKTIDTNNNYTLDVSGNINITGNIYKNGAIFPGVISSIPTLASVISQGNKANASIDMSLNNLLNVNNINLLSINGLPYTTKVFFDLSGILSNGNIVSRDIIMNGYNITGTNKLYSYDISTNYIIATTGSFTNLKATTLTISDYSTNVATTQWVNEWVKNQGYLTSIYIPNIQTSKNIDCSSIVITNNDTSIIPLAINCNNDNSSPTSFVINRTSSTPATSDKLFSIDINGSYNNNLHGYANIQARIDDVANGIGGWWFNTSQSGGLSNTRMHIRDDKVHITNVDSLLISSTETQIDSNLLRISNGYINQNAIPTGQKNIFKKSEFTELYVNGNQITGSGGASSDLSNILFNNNNAGGNAMNNVGTITAKQYIYDGFIKLNDLCTFSSTIGNYTMTWPIFQFYNIINPGTVNIYLPDLTLLPNGPGVGSTVFFLRGNNASQVYLNSFAGQELKLMDNSLTTSFLFNSTVSNMLQLMFTRVNSAYRWVQVNPLVSNNTTAGVIDTPSVYTTNSFTQKNTFQIGLESYGSTYVENFTFSNMSSDIIITNWDASDPIVSSGSYPLQASGNTTWTGTNGVIVSGSGYNFYVQRGQNFVFYNTYYPVASNQCFVLQTQQNQTINLKTINYSLTAGEYIFGFYVQSSNTGGVIELDVYAKNSLGTILGSELNVSPYVSFPNWEFHTIAFNIGDATDVYFEFQSNTTSYIYGGYVCLTGLELTQTNAIVVKDSATNKTATIGGSQTILNQVYINDGLKVSNGGVNINGGITSGTTYGSNNTTMNTILGSSNLTNPSNNVAIGASCLQNGTTAARNVCIGSNCLPYATTITDNCCIGYSITTSQSSQYNCVIGSQAIAKGSNNCVMGYNNYLTNQGSIGNFNVAIGSNSLGYNAYNGFGTLEASYNCAIGYNSQLNSTDYYNTSVGCESLYNMAGRNGITANGNNGYTTQKNVSIGYRSGYSQYRYNNCTFIGSQSDASIDNLTNATAIGYNCQVATSNTIQLGSNSETVKVSGNLNVNGTITGSFSINGYCDLSNTQIVGGVKTFSSPPIMSGAYITSGTIPITSIVGTACDLTTSQTIAGNKTFSGQLITQNQIIGEASTTVITGATSLASGNLFQFYSVSAGASAFNITLPTITTSNIGTNIIFRRVGGTTTTAVSFIGNGSQNVYNTALTGGLTAQALMGSGVYIVRLVALAISGTTYGWFQN